MSSQTTYQLVRLEAERALSGVSERDKRRLMDEIAYRIDIGDGSIDVGFMTHVLANLTGMRQTENAPMSSIHSHSSSVSSRASSSISKAETYLLEQQVRNGFGEGEELFKSDGRDFIKPEKSRYVQNSPVASKLPRFFNKVRYGVIWNRYAQTHYDEKNPPPQQVVGYKFNIIYADLIDPTIAPKYKLESSDSSDSLLLRFTSGPPYEDLVFKIVNKEWDLDRRSGFTCQFERGVLQLHFVFKKDKYRR